MVFMILPTSIMATKLPQPRVSEQQAGGDDRVADHVLQIGRTTTPWSRTVPSHHRHEHATADEILVLKIANWMNGFAVVKECAKK